MLMYLTNTVPGDEHTFIGRYSDVIAAGLCMFALLFSSRKEYYRSILGCGFWEGFYLFPWHIMQWLLRR